MTDDEEVLDMMRDVIAFIVARYRDDEIGAQAILSEADLAGMLIGLADYSLALIKTICKMADIPEDAFVDRMTESQRVVFGGVADNGPS